MSLDNSSAPHADLSVQSKSSFFHPDWPVISNSSSYDLTNVSLIDLYFLCTLTPEGTRGVLSFIVYCAVSLVVLSPLCSIVLYRGYRRRRSQTTASHSDVITYHMAVLESMGVLSMLVLWVGILRRLTSLQAAGVVLFSMVIPCRLLFHCLMCVERYLAAVHPVVYLGLKGAGGARARNVSVGCVWLLCIIWAGVVVGTAHRLGLVLMSAVAGFYVFCLLVILFCSGAVLRALVRPPPGGEQEVGGKRVEGGNQMKRRAFRIIVVILLVLLVKLVGLLVGFLLLVASAMSSEDMCATILSGFWFFLPTSLVVPLMFLYRTGPTPGCMRTET